MKKVYKDANGNSYEFTTRINSGGFGEIFQGKYLSTGEDVVLKTINIDNRDYRKALEREIEITTSLTHRNIVKVYLSGYDNDNDQFYLIMPFYKGGSLSDYLKKQTSLLPLDTYYDLFEQILEGFSFFHNKQIVHRDVKPQNILISNSNTLLISDFGMAKSVTDATITNSFKGGGTWPYMSPEAWKLESSCIQMDIYSLGIMFYQILTLELPFVGRDYNEWKDLHCYNILPNITMKRNDVPVKLKEIISKMTEKDKNIRYKTCNEVIASLKELKHNSAVNNQVATSLASLINAKNLEIEKQKSEEDRKREEQEIRLKNFNYSISLIFSKLEQLIIDTNANVENNRITYNYSHNSDGLRKMNIKHLSNSLSIYFFGINSISNYIKKQKEDGIAFQKNNYGMVMYDSRPSFYETNNIVLAGYVECNGNFNYSLNLLLKKEPSSDYGNWYAVTFDDIFVPYDAKSNYGFSDSSEFLKEYESSQITHVRKSKTNLLTDNDIQMWLQKFLI